MIINLKNKTWRIDGIDGDVFHLEEVELNDIRYTEKYEEFTRSEVIGAIMMHFAEMALQNEIEQKAFEQLREAESLFCGLCGESFCNCENDDDYDDWD